MRTSLSIRVLCVVLFVAGCVDQGGNLDPSGMAATLTPTSPASYPASISGPTAGDGVTSLQIRVAEQKLLDGVEAARQGLYGGGIRWRVKCTDGIEITIQPLGSVLTTVGGVWQTLPHTIPTTVSMIAGISAGTRYWVYASNVAGAVTFTKDTTAPDDGLKYKAGNTDYLYVSTFFVTSAVFIIPYTQNDNEYLYSTYDSVNTILAAGSATALTNVALGAETPAAATAVRLFGTAATSAAARRAYVTVSNGLDFGFSLSDDGVNEATGSGLLPLTDTAIVKYKVSNAGMALKLIVSGFTL